MSGLRPRRSVPNRLDLGWWKERATKEERFQRFWAWKQTASGSKCQVVAEVT